MFFYDGVKVFETYNQAFNTPAPESTSHAHKVPTLRSSNNDLLDFTNEETNEEKIDYDEDGQPLPQQQHLLGTLATQFRNSWRNNRPHKITPLTAIPSMMDMQS
eukprot:gene24441-30787_t